MPNRPDFETEEEWLEHLRLWFAGMFMNALESSLPIWHGNYAIIAESSYYMADAMLAEREKGK